MLVYATPAPPPRASARATPLDLHDSARQSARKLERVGHDYDRLVQYLKGEKDVMQSEQLRLMSKLAEAKMEAGRCAHIEAELEIAKEKIETLEAEITGAEMNMREAVKARSAAEAQIEELEDGLAAMGDQVVQLEAQVVQLEEQAETLLRQFDAAAARADAAEARADAADARADAALGGSVTAS